MTSIFEQFGIDNIDIESAPENPFDLEDGIYTGVVSNLKVNKGQRDDGSEYAGLIATLTPTGEDAGKEPFDYYMSLPTPADSERTARFKRSNIKNFYRGLGIPAERMNSATIDDIVTGDEIQFRIETTSPNAAGKTFRNVSVRLTGKSTPLPKDVLTSNSNTDSKSKTTFASATTEDDPFVL